MLTLDPAELGFQRWTVSDAIVGARLWLIQVPSGQSVAALSLDVNADASDTIDLLEDCYYLDVTVGGVAVETFAGKRAVGHGAERASLAFEPERHQIVFSGQLPSRNTEDIVQQLIYRSDLPYRAEYSAIAYPAELNRRPGSTAAAGPYVSVLAAQQDYIENCAFVSAIQCVASWVRLREIREEAYADLRLFRRAERRGLRARRHSLERVVDGLGELELELSYSVESVSDMELLVPSLRVAAYHAALFDCMGLRAKAETVGRMLQRLERSVRAELTAIESIERRSDENRRLRWTIALGFLSIVALPITIILAFFGANAAEVDENLSMFDGHYVPLYVLIASLMTLGIALSFGLYLQQRLIVRRERLATATSVLPAHGPLPRQSNSPGPASRSTRPGSDLGGGPQLSPTGDH
ncbi:hypothetical protein ACQPYA_13915 [Micromonospora sp. CA-263727]|uniref:hypothetical protein n=1 Tax=Micromonospora sp. CA-263727 TaxID=3239967 RepID=UPI003D8C02B0